MTTTGIGTQGDPAAPDAERAPRPQHRRAALTALLGQSIEFYDFYLYGTAAAVVLGPLFFPSANAATGTLAAFATFAAGFLLRPIGGIVFGHLGDRIGRKAVLVTTLLMMGLATVLIGVLPTYAQIGIWAPVLLVVLRCIQGLGIGGEWGGASLVSLENAPRGRTGLYGAIPQLGSPLGLLSSTLMMLLFGLLPKDEFMSWGWRVPFLLSAVLLVIGLVVRLTLAETPAFAAVKAAGLEARFPLLATLREAWRAVALGILVASLSGVGYYLINTFTITYATQHLGLSSSVGLVGQIITASIQAALVLSVGRLANARHPRIIGFVSCLLVAAWAFPLYGLINTAVPAWIWVAQAVATILITGLWAVLPTLLANQFPVHLRYTGVSIAYQGASVVGGFAPLVASWLLVTTNSAWAVATLFAVVAAISAAACLWSRRALLETTPAAVPAA